jgi:TetR/AcrR family transcriptional regulator
MTLLRQSRSDESRERILQAAIREFSEHGLAGARTHAIATAAGVNKALLYYYFRDKEALYTAALEAVAASVAESALSVLDLDCSPGERVLRFALQHFDRILCQQGFQALMQQEMVRFRTGQSHALEVIAKKAFQPIFARALGVMRQGVENGELCDVDCMQMTYAALGANVFYFLSAPVVRLTVGVDPLDPAAVGQRRTAALEFLGQALFVDRRQGLRLARAVLSAMPMPQVSSPEQKTA